MTDEHLVRRRLKHATERVGIAEMAEREDLRALLADYDALRTIAAQLADALDEVSPWRDAGGDVDGWHYECRWCQVTSRKWPIEVPHGEDCSWRAALEAWEAWNA